MTDTAELARQLFAAYLDGSVRVPAPSSLDGAFNMDSAYAVEAAIAQMHGSRPAGIKVGYANKAMWRVLKLETLVWAHMYEDTVHYAYGGSAEYGLPAHRAPKIEPEIVFKLKEPITTAGLDAAAVLHSVES